MECALRPPFARRAHTHARLSRCSLLVLREAGIPARRPSRSSRPTCTARRLPLLLLVGLALGPRYRPRPRRASQLLLGLVVRVGQALIGEQLLLLLRAPAVAVSNTFLFVASSP